tara:strand:+ start:7068 stop:7601 length:534 start_codon:yes stop_codon:yes gene_type:complete
MQISLLIKKPLYREYFKFLFPADESDIHMVSRTTDLGKFICALVKYSEVPVPEDTEENKFTLHLPVTKSLNLAPHRYLYFDSESIIRINDMLEVYFNLDFDRYYLRGLAKGYQQKLIIESFIFSRKLTLLMSDNETLKKREYRQALILLGEKVEELRCRAYNRNQRIEFEPEKYLIN